MKLLAILFLPILLASCRNEADGGAVFRITSYNVQNLFDASLDGTEYQEYLPGSGWSEASYLARVDRLGSLLLSGSLSSTSVFFLQEVENLGVVETLVKRKLASHGLGCYAFAKREGDAVGIGMVSRSRPDWVRCHTVEGSRPVLEAAFDEGRLVLLGCHARSRLDGQASEATRIALARVVSRVCDEYPSSLVIALGDFNEDPDEGYASATQTALVPSGLGQTALWSRQGSLVVSGSRHIGPGLWFNPWMDSAVVRDKPGSYAYSGMWHQYDQILGSWRLFDGQGWEFSSFSVHGRSPLVASDGAPLAWDRKLLTGYSDHLPVSMELYELPEGR